MKMLETVGSLYIYISNLIEEKNQAFLCSICDVYGR